MHVFALFASQFVLAGLNMVCKKTGSTTGECLFTWTFADEIMDIGHMETEAQGAGLLLEIAGTFSLPGIPSRQVRDVLFNAPPGLWIMSSNAIAFALFFDPNGIPSDISFHSDSPASDMAVFVLP